MARILLLEDDLDVGEPLSELLALDHDVRYIRSGLEAARLAGQERFDLAILDFDVDELSGEAALRVFRDVGPSPIIVISGSTRAWRQASFDAGATALLPKPFDVNRLLAMIDDLTRRPPAEGDARWPSDVRTLPDRDLARIAALSRSDLDALPFGVFRLSASGVVEEYNAFEARVAGRIASQVIGKTIDDIAPCIAVREFVNARLRSANGEAVDEVLRYVFPRFGGEGVVNVRLWSDAPKRGLWLFVSCRTPEQSS